MRPRLYINATVISYPTRKPARDLVVARHQQSIRDRPATESVRFKLLVSEFVHPETRTRDPDAVRAPLSTPSLLATPNTTADDDRFEARLIRTTALSPGEEPGLRALRYRGYQWRPVTRKIGLSPHHQYMTSRLVVSASRQTASDPSTVSSYFDDGLISIASRSGLDETA